MDSSKIKKNIRSIIFPSANQTIITFEQTFTPAQHNKAVKERPSIASNMSRHDDFNNAMQVFKVHLMLRSEFIEPFDRTNCLIEANFFTDHIFEDDDRFKGVSVKGIIFTTKEDQTGFQIIGQKLTSDGQVIPLKSPAISTLRLPDGENVYNYRLLELAKDHVDNLLTEADSFMKYKSSAMTLFSSDNVTKMTPREKKAAAANDNNRQDEMSENIAAVN